MPLCEYHSFDPTSRESQRMYLQKRTGVERGCACVPAQKSSESSFNNDEAIHTALLRLYCLLVFISYTRRTHTTRSHVASKRDLLEQTSVLNISV
jgi:hypothetical protein